MSNGNTQLFLHECAQKFQRSEEEIKRALTDLGLARRVGAGTRIDADQVLKLSQHFNSQKKAGGAEGGRGNRKISSTEVTERKSAARHKQLRRLSLAELRQQRGTGGAPAAQKPAPAAKAAAAGAATEKAAKKAAADSTPAAPEKSAAAPRNGGYDIAQLLGKQIAHKEQQAEKEKQLRDADRESKAKPAEKKAAPKSGGTITLGQEALAHHRRKRKKSISRSEARQQTAENQHTFRKPAAPVVREVKIAETMSIGKLATEMALKSGAVIRKLMDHGMTVTTNELLDRETAWIIVEELGHKPVDAPADDEEMELLKQGGEGSDIQPRAPVITVMGHVDHGKTSLLDHIRKTRVAPGEAGGITQHIGAYRVETAIGPVTFIDTPGHALFTQMRARGAKVTDIVLLVVAADDGIKPQTVEAINHAQAAGVPLVVAANKMDKPEADLERVKRELSSNSLLPEDWGGDTIVIPVSAQTGEGVERLLEALAMQTELLELRAPLDVPAAGIVIEARVDKGRGTVASLVVQRGVLKPGNAFLCGSESGRIKTMWNLSNPRLDAAAPSMPVEIQGLSGIPEAGAELLVVEDERSARNIAALRQERARLGKRTARRLTVGEEQDPTALLDAASSEQEWKELNIIVKADVEGSREAMAAALAGIAGKNAGVKVIHSAVGAVTESDIYLAQAGGSAIVAFNVRPDNRTCKLAESRSIKILSGNVVYDLVEKVQEAVLGLLSPTIEETVIGNALVQKVFGISKVGNIAGCLVEDGVVLSKAPLRLVRDGVVVHEGVMSSLHHFKDEAAEIRAGSECGIGISRYNDIKAGDKIEVLKRTEIAPEM